MKFKKLNKNANTPSYATEGAAAFDLSACLEATVWVHPGQTVMVGTGLAFQPSESSAVVLLPRSGLGTKHGIVLGNLVGLCDEDYTGEYIIAVWNRNQEGEAFPIQNGDRICQAMVVPIIRETFEEVDNLEETKRGSGGFGSTGKCSAQLKNLNHLNTLSGKMKRSS